MFDGNVSNHEKKSIIFASKAINAKPMPQYKFVFIQHSVTHCDKTTKIRWEWKLSYIFGVNGLSFFFLGLFSIGSKQLISFKCRTHLVLNCCVDLRNFVAKERLKASISKERSTKAYLFYFSMFDFSNAVFQRANSSNLTEEIFISTCIDWITWIKFKFQNEMQF